MRKLILLLVCACLCGIVSAAEYWDNSTGNNDFTDPLNWGNDGGPTTLPAVDIAGTNQAVLTDTATGITKLWVGFNAGKTGEMTIDGGDLTCSQFFYAGYNGNGTLNMESGSLTITTYDVTLAKSSGSTGTMVMNGGTVNAGRYMIVGAAGNGFFEMNGGTINVNTYDFQIAGEGEGSANSVGSVNMNDGTINAKRGFTVGRYGDGTLNMYGGEINVDILSIAMYENSTGTLNLYGGTINAREVVMRADATNVINILGDGMIVMDSSYSGRIQGLIDSGKIVGGQMTVNEATGKLTVGVIPEPATLMLLGLGSLAMIRRKR